MSKKTPSPEETPEEFPSVRESKLELYGQSLLIGVVDPSSKVLGKPFDFATLDYQLEAKIDKARNRKGGPGNHPAKVATETLAQTLIEWGGDTDFATKNHAHKIGALEAAFMEDILYAWVCLRVKTMGNDLSMKWECASCDHEFQWDTDLHGLSLTIVDELPKPVPLTLIYPIAWGKDTIDAVDLVPPKWGAACGIKGVQRRGGLGDVKAAMVRSAIRNVRTKDGGELPLASRVFEQLHKRDRERMSKALDSKAFPRCDLRFEVECPECGFVQTTALDWTWDFFFGSASLPPE